MRVILSGGGTGGHIYPAITIARAIAGLAEPCEFLFVGTREGLEADLVPKEGFPFTTVEVRGFERRITWTNLKTLFASIAGVWHCRRIVQQFRPDVVIGTGGYVCGPVLMAAALMGVPTLIQEQNVVPGITNRILSRVVKCAAVGYEEAAPYFTRHTHTVVTGNPIRPEVMSASREEGVAALGLDPQKLTLLAVGGSRGARSINNAMTEVHASLAGDQRVQVLHVTGKNEYNNVVGILQQRSIDFSRRGNISIIPYLYNMPQALAAADLAVFRAGAVGLAELTARGIASILVPYPYAAENHQEFNARVLEQRGAAVVVKDAELDGKRLTSLVRELLDSPERLEGMRRAAHSLGHPDAALDIARLALEISRRT